MKHSLSFGSYGGMSRHAFGDVASDLIASTDANTAAGLQALNYFWQAAQSLNPQMPTDFPTFLAGLEQAMCPVSADVAWPGYAGPYYPTKTDTVFTLQVQGIGQMVNTAGTVSFWASITGSQNIAAMPASQVQAAMAALAQAGGGKLPTSLNQIAQYLEDQSTQVSFLSAAWYVAQAVVVTAAQGAAQVGNAALAVGEGALNAVNTFAQYETYFIVAALGVAGYLGYTFYLKPLMPKHSVQSNPKRKARKRRKKNPCMTGTDGSEVCF